MKAKVGGFMSKTYRDRSILADAKISMMTEEREEDEQIFCFKTRFVYTRPCGLRYFEPCDIDHSLARFAIKN